MRKKSKLLLTVALLTLTMTALPVFAKDSTINKQQVESNPELTIPSTSVQTAKSKVLKTVSAPVKLDTDQIGRVADTVVEKNGKGIYFLREVDSYDSEYEIVFYDIQKQTYTAVYAPSRASYCTYYIDTNHAIYFLNQDYEWSGTDEDNYTCTTTLCKYDFENNTSSETHLDDIEVSEDYSYDFVPCFGVDRKGRIYVATHNNNILLFNKDGKMISKTPTSNSVSQFCGFDPVNGNFYYISHYNWVYWGYDHDMASIMAGNVNENNELKVTDKNIMILYQYDYLYHKNPVTMLDDRYLAALSIFNSDIGLVLDSNAYDYTDVTDQTTDIDLINNDISASLINISNKNAVKAAFLTADSDYNDYGEDVGDIGSRCAVNTDETSLLVKTDSNILSEYDINTQENKMQVHLKHPVYTFGMKGDQCIAVEKDGDDFYLESIDWVYPSEVYVESPDSLTVGSSGKISCTTDSDSFKLNYTYESSDSSIVSVDKKGKLNAFKSGTATITIKAPQINVTKQVTITVTDTELSLSNTAYRTSNLANRTSDITHSYTNESDYGHTQTSYLTALNNGNYERIEYINGKIVREVYNASFKRVSSSTIPFELSIWGGYFSGQNYNFLLFGQKNPKESDKQEVYRIVKYDKNWKRLGSCSIKGANTFVPFEGGGADMTETNGKLYIHTCHTMYASDDDELNHQANCTFVMNEDSLKIVDSYYDVMNLSYGYVSHSFSQQIATDGSYIFRADLGDAYPRGIALTITKVDDHIYDPSIYGSALEFSGPIGLNYTGFTLDALELTEDYYMLAGTGTMSGGSAENIYVNCGPKDNPVVGGTWITNHKSSDNIQVLCPKLVALNKSQFLLMWEEQNTKTEDYTTKMVLLNENGQKASNIYSSKISLSKCDPVVTPNGMVAWYITTDESPILVEINPYQLSKVSSSTRNLTAFHQHKWDSGKVIKQSTYTARGLKTYTCKICKVKKTKNLPLKSLPAAGTKYTISGNTYKVKKAGKEVSLVRANTKVTSLTIPRTITAQGLTYQVTSIEAKAFKNNKKIKTVTVGSNIAKISNNAFYKCSNLKTVKMNTLKLTKKTASSKAFSGVSKKLVIKVPKKVKKTYKKIFKGRKVK